MRRQDGPLCSLTVNPLVWCGAPKAPAPASEDDGGTADGVRHVAAAAAAAGAEVEAGTATEGVHDAEPEAAGVADAHLVGAGADDVERGAALREGGQLLGSNLAADPARGRATR